MNDERADAWLLLAVAEDRQHGGNEGYADEPANVYRWDSTVPNSGAIAEGDLVVLWDKKSSLGIAIVESIERGSSTKKLYRCPSCKRSSIKRRRTKAPLFRCQLCTHEFDRPLEENRLVQTFAARYKNTWIDLSGRFEGSQLRAMARDPKSQLSLRPLKRAALFRALKPSDLDALERRRPSIP